MKIANHSVNYYGLTSSVYRTYSSLFFAVTYKIVALAARIIGNKQLELKHTLSSDFYSQRANAIWSYLLFRGHLINPSVNLEKVESLTERVTFNPKKLAKLFLKEKSLAHESLYLKKKKLRIIKNGDGVCLAASLKFISDYFKLIKKEKSGLKTVEALSQKFKEGFSEKTAIINQLQDTRECSAACNQKEITLKCFQLTAHHYHLKLEKPKSSLPLKKGLYTVFYDSKDAQNPGHAAVYINTKDAHFLFDPNVGTVLIPKGSDQDFLNLSMELCGNKKMRFIPVQSESS